MRRLRRLAAALTAGLALVLAPSLAHAHDAAGPDRERCQDCNLTLDRCRCVCTGYPDGAC